MGTGICEEVGCDYPISRVEAMEGVCNGDKRSADNCSLNCGKKKCDPESISGCQPVHQSKYLLPKIGGVDTQVSTSATSCLE